MISTRVQHRGCRPGRAMLLALVIASCLVLGQLSAKGVAAKPSAQGTTVVRCEPSSVSGFTDQTLTVDLYIQDVIGLYGADLKATFDPDIGQIVDELSGSSGVQLLPLNSFLQPDYIARNEADNVAGTFRYAATQAGRPGSVTGSGAVARIRFTALTAGTFTVTFTQAELSDRNGVSLPNTTQSCTVTFEEPADVGCDPAVVSGYVDQILTLNLQIANVTRLYGADLGVTFDPTIAHVVDEDPGTGGVQILPLGSLLQPDFIARREADNTAGKIQYAVVQTRPDLPAAGAGPVAQIRFQALSPGEFTMAFTQHELSDLDGRLLSNTVRTCTVRFTEIPNAVTLTRFGAWSQQGLAPMGIAVIGAIVGLFAVRKRRLGRR